jgi:hypothetical protein
MIFRSDLFFADSLEIGLGFEIAGEMSFSGHAINERQDMPQENKNCSLCSSGKSLVALMRTPGNRHKLI